ncbi:MAG: aminomethyl-transferring glycine dehydrogenase subunit GcvPB [Myxococcales bacterium]|jgi:glycine dehydrogenase subunit 2|nr:aminomethyl-transferring glycine dehydrogenase subunit GcvPB [Myxococcales bacterium]
MTNDVDHACPSPSHLAEEPLLFEKPRHDTSGASLPLPGVPEFDPTDELDARLLRRDVEAFPTLSEPEVVRHFTRLSQQNFGVDTGLYPLGSCTMKYNPKLGEAAARLRGFTDLHPLLPDAKCQGALALMWRLERALACLLGFEAVSLAPAAGAQGELTGMLVVRAAHQARGERRRLILIPDSAHGTNPASCTLAGYQIVQLKSGPDGLLAPATVAAALDAHGTDVAALMMTNPNTLGLFETGIREIADLLHAKGALLYGDGANLNALLGRVRPADLGIDVMHVNLHKTFAAPHGGGGPGAGPIAVTTALADFLPSPRVVRERRTEAGSGWTRDDALPETWEDRSDGGTEVRYRLDADAPQSIGRVRSFFGNFGVCVRAYAYIAELGARGLREVSGRAVLNANYVRAQLCDDFELPCAAQPLHEVVFTDERQKPLGVTTMDIAKALIDRGFHPPTIYFPLVVQGALMIEPTETESKETLDAFVAAMKDIARAAREAPESLRAAPILAFRERLDETQAARKPVLRWRR